jgi:tRNA (guanine-N7-)-methyltransferase
LEIEMGSGKGLFLEQAATDRQQNRFLGIELARKYAAYCAGRLARRSLSNAKVVFGDGVRMFQDWLPDQCAAAVHVYFPDPWWKKRHRKRRIMNEGFVRNIERVLQTGGQLHFWTDVDEYFHETLTLLAAATRLSGPRGEPEQEAQHDLDFRTHFERRCRHSNVPVWRAIFVRPAVEIQRLGS